MHYHLEIVMPPTDDIEAAIMEILAPFDENCENQDIASKHAFWDWYRIGGRWSGAKLEALLGEQRIADFRAALQEANITVSGVQAGKPTLSPADQRDKVDAMWNAMFPDSPVKTCPLFDHYKGDFGDAMPLGECPEGLACSHLIVAASDWRDEKIEAVFMIQESVWNGVNYVETKWDGTLASGVAMCAEKFKHYKAEYAEKRTPRPDWLVVTVDYHS
jgi:hypothetical protein